MLGSDGPRAFGEWGKQSEVRLSIVTSVEGERRRVRNLECNQWGDACAISSLVAAS